MQDCRPSRRTIMTTGAALITSAAMPGLSGLAQPMRALTRRIPTTGEEIPAVGLGTWITFNVGNDAALRAESAAVMAAFFEAGGRVIDSSPMYGSSQDIIGYGLKKLGSPEGLFSAEKVWTSSAGSGPAQIERSRSYWGVSRFDLMQVHNLVSWQSHLPMLFEMKAAGRLRYVGITTSEGRRHDLVENLMRTQPIDFVQVTYNVLDREVEQRILPLAEERRIGVIVNRPFRQGALTERLAKRPLPAWAADIGAASWAQFILKFILSHPAITVVIPATTRPEHARENLAAATGRLPDSAFRERMSAHVRSL